MENWSPLPLSVTDKGKEQMNGSPPFSPVGLKVLVVDDNRVCLAVLTKMLQQCMYSVTTCNSAAKALSLVQGKDTFDLVLCDVHMPGMDGFKLLKAISLEGDLPVIMMSSDDETDVVMKGITQGACDYFLKPVRLQRLQTIWQHVFRRREMGDASGGRDCDSPDGSDPPRASKFRTARDNSRKRKGKEEAVDDPGELANLSKKKTRLVWTPPLHKQFVDAVKNLGTANAVPKQILEKMNVKGISRENVASHLQKYRKYLIDQEAASGEEKDLNGAVNSYPHSFDPYQIIDSFIGSIEVQPGAVNASPFTLSSLHSPPPPPPPPQNFSTQPFTSPQIYNSTLQPFAAPAATPAPPPQSFSNHHQHFSAPQNFTPSQTFSTPQQTFITSGFNSNLSTELYPVPSQQSFPVIGDVNFRLNFDGAEPPESLAAMPSIDVASSSNISQRLRQFQGLGEVVRPGLVQPSAFYNSNLSYQS